MVAPFRATLKGTVGTVSDPELTLQGNAKRNFGLIDSVGAWIRCCALLHNAGSRALVCGTDVVLYYTTARKSRGSAPGMLYLMKDALIVPVGRHDGRVEKKIEIVIQ